MSGSPMQPDAVLALPTAKPALMGPEAAINAHPLQPAQGHRGRRTSAPRSSREKRAEYEADIDVFKIANENAIEAVVSGDDLRAELIARFDTYRLRPLQPPARRNGVYPV